MVHVKINGPIVLGAAFAFSLAALVIIAGAAFAIRDAGQRARLLCTHTLQWERGLHGAQPPRLRPEWPAARATAMPRLIWLTHVEAQAPRERPLYASSNQTPNRARRIPASVQSVFMGDEIGVEHEQ